MSAKISGHVSSNGSMLKGVKVACYGMETRTLADGFFIFESLSTGTHKVNATLQGFKSARKTVSIKEGEEAITNFNLSKAKGAAKIHGHIYDATSKEPVRQSGTVILIFPVANKYGSINMNGYYEFENLPAGTFKILTSIPGYKDNYVNLTVTDNETTTNDFFCTPQEIEEPPWG